jgi:preprotein translocase subunit YajC
MLSIFAGAASVGAAAQGPTGFAALLGSPITMMVLMLVVFYFLLIRPQQKRAKEHRDMVEGLRRGDEVVTQGGLIGKVSKVADNELTVELAEGVKVQVVRATIVDVRNRTAPAAANDGGDDEKKS